MTFIASVVARDGVAIIADSLVTTSKQVISSEDFIDYINQKASNGSQIQLELHELFDLFAAKESYTRDFEEKIFEYDRYTAITTAGNAIINGKRIRQIVAEKKAQNQGVDYPSLTLDEKIKDFCDFIEDQIKASAQANPHQIFQSTTFIITHFDTHTSQTIIHQIETEECSATSYKDPDYRSVQDPELSYAKIVCEGQNRISHGILYGGIDGVVKSVNNTIEILATKYGFDKSAIDLDKRNEIISSCMEKNDDNIQLRKISDLSLQQAVDLAALLMRLEMDFQKYTANIPTVGGVIKIATINQDGFRYVSGHEIIRPKLM